MWSDFNVAIHCYFYVCENRFLMHYIMTYIKLLSHAHNQLILHTQENLMIIKVDHFSDIKLGLIWKVELGQ